MAPKPPHLPNASFVISSLPAAKRRFGLGGMREAFTIKYTLWQHALPPFNVEFGGPRPHEQNLAMASWHTTNIEGRHDV